MSAYGAIDSRLANQAQLASTIWPLKTSTLDGDKLWTAKLHLTLHHLTLKRALALPGLVEYLHTVFAHFIEEGATYPQETAPGEMYERTAFETYFFAGDVIVAVIGSGLDEEASKYTASMEDTRKEATEISVDIDAARAGRTWQESVAGFYYVRIRFLCLRSC